MRLYGVYEVWESEDPGEHLARTPPKVHLEKVPPDIPHLQPQPVREPFRGRIVPPFRNDCRPIDPFGGRMSLPHAVRGSAIRRATRDLGAPHRPVALVRAGQAWLGFGEWTGYRACILGSPRCREPMLRPAPIDLLGALRWRPIRGFLPRLCCGGREAAFRLGEIQESDDRIRRTRVDSGFWDSGCLGCTR
jgi:hypothetical protein